MKSDNKIRPLVNITDNASVDLLFDVLDDESLHLLSLEELQAVNKRLDAHFNENTVVPKLENLVRQVSSKRCRSKVTEISTVVDLVEVTNDAPVIKIMGVGGGGSNAVQHMVVQGIKGVDFICANTDAQALKSMSASTVLHIGHNVTKGLGAGSDPEVGRQAAMEDRDRVQDIIQGTDMLFIAAGMGGGTGSGAIPVVAQIAREMGVLTVAVVTRPFPFEGRKRMHIAQQGIDELRSHVDSLITIPNEKLLSVLGKNISLIDAFNAANDVLRGAVQCITELITSPGLINVDFADVRTVMSEMGLAMMGSGIGRGDDRATEAAEMAISSPLLEGIDLLGAQGMLVNITCGPDMAIGEFEEVGNVVRRFAADDATVVVGTAIDANLEGELRVTVVATGLGQQQISMGINRGKATGTNEIHSIGEHQLLAVAGGRNRTPPPHGAYQTFYRDAQHNISIGNGDSNDMKLLDIPAFLRR